MANHPPEGFAPNVEAIPVQWSEWEPPGSCSSSAESSSSSPTHASTAESAESVSESVESVESAARELVNPPTTAPWYVDGATGVSVAVPPTVPTRGLVFLASRPIPPGAEIYFNYRLNPKSGDEWYAPVPEEWMWRVIDEAREKAQAARGAAEEEEEEGKKAQEEGRRRGNSRGRTNRHGGGDWGTGALQ